VPTTVINCRDSSTLSATTSELPANETFSWLALGNPETGQNFVLDGFSFTTDASGSATTLSATFDLPLDVSFVVYRDTDENRRWSPDGDDTLDRGDGTVSTCASVTLTSK